MAAGLRRILFGLFKKLVIADQLAKLVAATHANPSAHSSLELLLGAYCFALQLYADFSGVTDIAIGLGMLFGVKGPENFQMPFFASNMQEFWRRWHISLTSWLSDYLFAPLMMSLRGLGALGLSIAIFINMVAVGMWHGASWNAAAFGALNGVYLIVSVFTLKSRNVYIRTHPLLTRARVAVAPLITFHLVVFALTIFRANSPALAIEYVKNVIPWFADGGVAPFRLEGSSMGLDRWTLLVALAGVGVMETLHWACRRPDWSHRFLAAPRSLRWGAYYATIFVVVLYGNFRTQQFIYAQF